MTRRGVGETMRAVLRQRDAAEMRASSRHHYHCCYCPRRRMKMNSRRCYCSHRQTRMGTRTSLARSASHRLNLTRERKVN